MGAARQRFSRRYSARRPRTHGAAGWQINAHALRLTQRLGFDYCSDGRGIHPHLPVRHAELIRCPQFPTTLPTLDELIGTDGFTEQNVAAHLLDMTREPREWGHVFTLHAELEGIPRLPVHPRVDGRAIDNHAYRCLPLVIANNGHGWTICRRSPSLRRGRAASAPRRLHCGWTNAPRPRGTRWYPISVTVS